MERNGEVLRTALKAAGEGRAFLKRVGKGRIKKGFALAFGLAVSGGAVRTPTRGCIRRLSRALCAEAVRSGGRRVESTHRTEPCQVRARSRGELTGQTGGRRGSRWQKRPEIVSPKLW